MRRREFLHAGAATVGVGTLALSGCDRVIGRLSRAMGADLPSALVPPDADEVDAAHHLLNRAAFGPWPGDRDRIDVIGTDAWIEEQLSPTSIGDLACDMRTGAVDTVHMEPSLVAEFRPEEVERQLVSYTVLRAVYSRRQLQEVLVSLWSDHFNIAIGKSHCRWLKTGDDRDVLRSHALGNFRDLVRASALSPAMLVYLDGASNVVRTAGDVANENYARELLELHTLGVHGGYDQDDVMETARCLTGWKVDTGWWFGRVRFEPRNHDDGAKTVLGVTIPGGGADSDLDALLDVLLAHPACARFVTGKLCRFFLSDPSASLRAEAAEAFVRRDPRTGRRYEIRPVVEMILRSAEFAADAGRRLKRPFRFVVSSLRSVGADVSDASELTRFLERMGQAPFRHPTPDGYPLEAHHWLGTLLWRWNFALSLAENRMRKVRLDLPRLLDALGMEPEDLAWGRADASPLLRHVLGRRPRVEEMEPLTRYLSEADPETAVARVAALTLASPAFQRH